MKSKTVTSKAGWTWDYRIVNTPSINGGDAWYALHEVHYQDGVPVGYTDPCIGTDEVSSLAVLGARIAAAFTLPVLHEDDIGGAVLGAWIKD